MTYSTYHAAFDHLAARSVPAVFVLAIGTVLVLLSAFGALLPAYFAGLALTRSTLRPVDWFPFFLLIAYCSILIAFPMDGGELQHRTFALVYAALTVWCGAFVARGTRSVLPRYGQMILVTCCVPLIVYPFFAADAVQAGGNKWAAAAHVNFRVPEGLLKSVDYIRSNSAVGDVVWSDKGDPWAVITGLTERTSFTSLEPIFANLPGPTRHLIDTRLSISNELRRASSPEQFASIATAAGIDWCVVAPDYHLPESFYGKVEFAAAGYRVLRVKLPPT